MVTRAETLLNMIGSTVFYSSSRRPVSDLGLNLCLCSLHVEICTFERHYLKKKERKESLFNKILPTISASLSRACTSKYSL